MTDSSKLASELIDELRQDNSGYRREPGVPEFFGFDTRRHVFTLRERDLAPIQRKLDWIEEPVRVPLHLINGATPHSFAIPIAVEGLRTQAYPLNLGLVLISGGTKAGKSRFVKSLAKLIRIQRMAAVEPDDTPEDIVDTPYYSSADSALAAVVQRRYQGDVDTLFAIDSLRAPLFETSGNASSKGISMPFLTQLTRVSQELARAGMTVLATVNPMEEDVAFTEAFLSKLSASTSTSIMLTSSVKSGRTWKFTGTVSSRPDRADRRFTLEVTEDARPVDVSTTISELTFTPAGHSELSVLNDQDIQNSLQKVI